MNQAKGTMVLPINFNHLYYFWVVVKQGGVTQAARELHLTQPTVSAQLKRLEETLGVDLFDREGRKLVLTSQGRVTFEYADRIFGLGNELVRAVHGHEELQELDLTVGVMDVLPKHLVYHFLTPALSGEQRVRVRCYEGKLEQLLLDLSNHRLDVVFSDSPLYHNLPVEAQTHFLGECGVVVMGNRELLAKATGETLGQKVASLPVLLPTSNTALRRVLDRWFDTQQFVPQIVGEFEDSGLLKVFALQGLGLCFVPAILEKFLGDLYRLESLGLIEVAKSRFYAIAADRMVKHPVVTRLTEAARLRLAPDQQQESGY